MSHVRRDKIKGMADDIPLQKIEEGADEGKLLVLGWGSTYGAIREAVRRVRAQGHQVSHAQLRYLNPFPRNLLDVLSKFDKILVPELNLGQLSRLIKSEFLIPVESYTKIQGQPFHVAEMEARILQELK
jgi:2-oxoglutarate ferredoxin oxidoreductase subunit alpha